MSPRTVRYFWETYARTSAQGSAFFIQATFLTKRLKVPARKGAADLHACPRSRLAGQEGCTTHALQDGRSRRPRRPALLPRAFLHEKGLDSRAYVVANRADPTERLALRILERPVIAPHAWNVRALVATTHRDQQLRLSREIRGEPPRPHAAQVDPFLPHDCDDLWMNALPWIRSGRKRLGLRGIRQLVEQCSRHLRATGIMNARE
jgi:hypothetical protein